MEFRLEDAREEPPRDMLVVPDVCGGIVRTTDRSKSSLTGSKPSALLPDPPGTSTSSPVGSNGSADVVVLSSGRLGTPVHSYPSDVRSLSADSQLVFLPRSPSRSLDPPCPPRARRFSNPNSLHSWVVGVKMTNRPFALISVPLRKLVGE